jgi:hypothetical protein
MPCVNTRKLEIRRIAQRFPWVIEKVEKWERLVSEASKRGCSTFFANPGEQNIHYSTHGIRKSVDWSMTSWGGKQYDMNAVNEEHEASVNMCKSEYGLCE